MAEILSGGLTWGSIQQAIVTMDKEGHPLTCCNPVTGECLDGGGSSDFSTAEVTVVNTVPANTLIGTIVNLTINGTDYTAVNPVAIDNNKCTIPLINKSAFVEIHIAKPQEGSVPIVGAAIILSVEGDAEIVPEYQAGAKVFGNCTITIGDAYTA